MSRKKKIQAIADQIMYFSDGKVLRPIAEAEAEAYLRRSGIGSLFVHGSSISSAGKKLAFKCMGTPIV